VLYKPEISEDDEAAMLYIQNSNPNASYQAGLKFSSFNEERKKPKAYKRSGAHFNINRIDPRKI
jgi:hypothetical protein